LVLCKWCKKIENSKYLDILYFFGYYHFTIFRKTLYTQVFNMARAFGATSQKVSGCAYDVWFANCISGQGFKQGELMSCLDINGNTIQCPKNAVGILFQDCHMMALQNSSNHGIGGSNCPTGTPFGFVSIESWHPVIFNSRKDGLAAKMNKPFILPLADIAKYPDTLNMTNDCFAAFVAGTHGGNKHDPRHVAVGICSALANGIVFNLAQHICASDKQPDAKRLTDLVEIMHALAGTAISCAEFKPATIEIGGRTVANAAGMKPIGNIFRTLPLQARSGDTLQSVVLGFIFDILPSLANRANYLGTSIVRYFIHNGASTSFVNSPPSGLVALILVAPMLASLINTDLPTRDIVNRIIKAINSAVASIVALFKEHSFATLNVHMQNKSILTEYAKACYVPLVPPEMIAAIYDLALIGGKPTDDFASKLGVVDRVPFRIDTHVTLLGKALVNYASTPCLDHSGRIIRATFMPSDVREWSCVSLKQGKYVISCEAVGNANFVVGNTKGMTEIANFRITSGTEVLNGPGARHGFAASGMVYVPATRQFSQFGTLLEQTKPFTMESIGTEIVISQSHREIIRLNTNVDDNPLFCFKYCAATITQELPAAPVADVDPVDDQEDEPLEQIVNLATSLRIAEVDLGGAAGGAGQPLHRSSRSSSRQNWGGSVTQLNPRFGRGG